jgi:hypothetical protein
MLSHGEWGRKKTAMSGRRGSLQKKQPPGRGVDFYARKSENLPLTFSEISPKNLPSLRWERMKGRGDQKIPICPPLSEPEAL